MALHRGLRAWARARSGDEGVAHLPVPLARQESPESCGAAAAQSVLAYWRAWSGDEDTLRAPLDLDSDVGVEVEAITELLRRAGLMVEGGPGHTVEGLESALAAGSTPILMIQAWPTRRVDDWRQSWDDGHYVVLVAIDGGRAYLMDPATRGHYVWIPVEELVARHRGYDSRQRRDTGFAIVARGEEHLPVSSASRSAMDGAERLRDNR